MTKISFGARLLRVRVERGMSQAELAAAAGVAAAQVSRYEADKNLPRPHVVARLASALSVDAAWLMQGDDDAPSTQIRFEQSESGDATLVLRPSPELGARMRQMADLAGITPNDLLRRIIEEWARQGGGSPEEVADHPYFADLRARVDRLEKALEEEQVTAVLTENTTKPPKKPPL